MSMTINQSPNDWTPAYNDMVFVVDSTNKAQTNHNYIAQLYIGSDVITLKCPPDPTYGKGVFNVGRIVESYVNSDVGDNGYTGGFIQNGNSIVPYYVKFGEEYGSTVTQYLAQTTTAYKYAWNACLDFVDMQNYSRLLYFADDGAILNNTSITRCIELTQSTWLYFNTVQMSRYSLARINSFNSAGTQIRGITVTNTYNSSGTVSNHCMRFQAGPYNINLIDSGVVTSIVGSGSYIPATTDYYTIQFDGSSASSVVRFNIWCSCSKHTSYRLHWLNKKGAFESFNFNMRSKKSSEIKKNGYTAPIGALTSSTTWGYALKDRVDRQYFIQAKDTLNLSTDWLTEAENLYLQELVESPEIYLDDATLGLISVTCKDTKYEVKEYVSEKLFRLEIELEYSYNRQRQRY